MPLPYFIFISSSLKPSIFHIEAAFVMTWQNPSSHLPWLFWWLPQKHWSGRSHEAHTTESWRVRVIPGVLQAGDLQAGTLKSQLSDPGFIWVCWQWGKVPANTGLSSLVLLHWARYQQAPHQSHSIAAAQEPLLSRRRADHLSDVRRLCSSS